MPAEKFNKKLSPRRLTKLGKAKTRKMSQESKYKEKNSTLCTSLTQTHDIFKPKKLKKLQQLSQKHCLLKSRDTSVSRF